MVSITCPCTECVNNGKGYKCKAKSINMKYRNMVTVNEGMVDMWICNQYEKAQWAKEIDKMVLEIARERWFNEQHLNKDGKEGG